MNAQDSLQGSGSPEEKIRYVEVEVEQEVITHVPRTEVVVQERRVPKYEVVYKEKVIDRPRTQIVEKIVEVPHYVDKIREVPVVKRVEVPMDVIEYVPKVEVKVIEKEVEVPGQVIEVPKKVEVVNQKIVHKYVDTEVPTVIAQTFKPHIVESQEHTTNVKLKKFVPYVVPVEVFLPVAVERDLIAGETVEELQRVKMPPSQFNAQVKAANPDLTDEQISSLYVRYADGSIPVFNGPGAAPVQPHRQPTDGQPLHPQQTNIATFQTLHGTSR